VPEEVNRRIIDHCSDVLMPYTERSRKNLLREGIAGDRIFVTGNPINEVIQHYSGLINQSDIHDRLGLDAKKYFLVTMHREENVDKEDRLRSLIRSLELLRREFDLPIICSTHPRTRARAQSFGIDPGANELIQFHEPFGLFDFIALERDAFCVLSDSGTVQEECCIFRVANVTIRDVTERPETIECGSNMLSGAEPETILRCVRTVLDQKSDWTVPAEYLAENVSATVAKLLLGFSSGNPQCDPR
jgi:UDP-N-acetylglucosamine 2-epimerase (non-hydrolysing)